MPSKTKKRKHNASSDAANELLNAVWNKGVDAQDKAAQEISNERKIKFLKQAKIHFNYAKTLHTTNDNVLYDEQLLNIEDNIIKCNFDIFIEDLTNNKPFCYNDLILSYQEPLNNADAICDELPFIKLEHSIITLYWNLATSIETVLQHMIDKDLNFNDIKQVEALCKDFYNRSKERTNEKQHDHYIVRMIQLDLILFNHLAKKLQLDPSVINNYITYLQLNLLSFKDNRQSFNPSQCRTLKELVTHLNTFLKNNNEVLQSNEYQEQIHAIARLILDISRTRTSSKKDAVSWKNIYDELLEHPLIAETTKSIDELALYVPNDEESELSNDFNTGTRESKIQKEAISSVSSNSCSSPYFFIVLKSISSFDSHDLSKGSQPSL